MASIIDFQNLYSVIKDQLPDLGGLVSDFPLILKTVEKNAPQAMNYIRQITEKLLQDVASRESVYTENTTCKELTSALSTNKTIPPVINQHLEFIISKTQLPQSATNLDETYAAFESLISLLQWQHGKYYIVDDDDLDMLLTGDDSPVRQYGSVKRKSTLKNRSSFTDLDLVTTENFDSNDGSGDTRIMDSEHEKSFNSEVDEFEVKFTEKKQPPKPTKQQKPNQSNKKPKPDSIKDVKPEIKSVKTEMDKMQVERIAQPADIPATLITKDESLRQNSSAKTKTHVKRPKLMPKPGDSSENPFLPDTSGVSKFVREVYKPAKGPNPWIYVLVGFVALVFFTIGILWGKKFREDNFENKVTLQARFLFEEAASVRNLKSSSNYADALTAYDNILKKIDNFKTDNTSWNKAFEETIISLRVAKEELKREMDREVDNKNTMALVKEALKLDELLLLEEALDRVFDLLIKYPELSANYDTEVTQIETRLNKLKRIQDLIADMRLARRQADSLKESSELPVLYRNLGILKWFIDRLPNDDELSKSVTDLEQKIKNRAMYEEIEIRINYLIGIYDIAIKSENYNEVKVAMELINEFLIKYELQIDQNPEAPKYLKSSYRELTTKYSLLGVHEEELREEEKMLLYNILKKEADVLVYSEDDVKIRILIEKIEEFIVEHPDMRPEIDKSKQALLQQLELIKKLGNSREKITALIAEATDLLSSENPLEIGSMIVKINEFIKELPESEASFADIVSKLDSRKKMLEAQMSLSDRTNQLLEKAATIRSSSDMSAIVGMINEIDEFKRVSLRDEKKNAVFILKLEREAKKLSDRYQDLRNVKIIIDNPKNGKTFNSREVTIEGRVVKSNLKQVRVSLAGWEKVVNVENGSFKVDMMLVSGSNLIKVTASSNTYIGEASCEVICSVPGSELFVKLTWARSDSSGGEGIARPDLDLYVTEPTGKTVYFDNPYGDAGELLSDSREGEKPEIYELSTLRGHKIVEGTYFIRVKYAEDRSIPRKTEEPGKKLWAGYLPKPTPVKFTLTIFSKGKFYGEFTGEINRMDYIHNGHEAWLAYPKAWWDKSCPIVIAK